MLVLALCVSLYIFDLTPAEVWQWLCDVSGGVHAKGVAVYEQGAARRAERRAERQAAQEAADEYDETEDRSRSGRALPSGSAGLDVRCAALGP